MAARAYYNEVDAYAAEWIRNLIAAGLITAGDVDTRSIVDVHPSDLRGYARCHFFAGIGVWDYALGLAGWPADRPVWTGSCPCQPFSTAGRRGGTADERHLWPAWHHLIAECGPSEVLGEQVASADGLAWLDLVHADLDGLGYTFGAADLCAAGVGAPHIRQRLWFVADARGGRRLGREDASRSTGEDATEWFQGPPDTECGGHARYVGDAGSEGLPARQRCDLRGEGRREEGRAAEQPSRAFGGLGFAHRDGRQPRVETAEAPRHRGATVATGGWASVEWIGCRDGKARPTEPGLFPLAHGAPSRVGRLRAYGNAIVAPVAATFIAACLDLLPDPLSLAAE